MDFGVCPCVQGDLAFSFWRFPVLIRAVSERGFVLIRAACFDTGVFCDDSGGELLHKLGFPEGRIFLHISLSESSYAL